MRDGILRFSFTENYDSDNPLYCRIVDGFGKEQLNLALGHKALGANRYELDLRNYEPPVPFRTHKQYEIEVRDQLGRRHHLTFQLAPPLPPLKGHIGAVPLDVDCENPGKVARVSYTGRVSGGTPPYSVTWKIALDPEGVQLPLRPKARQTCNGRSGNSRCCGKASRLLCDPVTL